MKKISILGLGMCAALTLASCGASKESAYKKAYEKAQAQEAAQQAPVTTEPVVTPLEQAPATETTVTDVDNAVVRQENVSLVAGSGLQNFSVVVGSFGLKSNAEGLYNTLKAAGYDAQIVLGERNMYRVVAATFMDKASAVKSRNDLRAGKYTDAWLLFKK